MGIKNMPDFDDIDIGDEHSESKKSNKSKINIKEFFAALGVTNKEQLRPILQAFGYDKATIDEMLSSFSSFDDIQEALDALDEDALNLEGLMSSGSIPQMPPSMMGMPMASVVANPSQKPHKKDIYTEDEWEQEDIDDLDDIIDRFLQSQINSEECVNELCELLADLNYCFNGDLQHVEDTLDNMRNSGTTASEIKDYISSNVSDIEEDDNDEDDDLDLDEETDENNSDDEDDFSDESESKSNKQIKIFNDNLKEMFEREDKLYSVEYVPFSAREFKTHFDIDDDDLEENKIAISKFADIIPESWSEHFEFVTLATAFIEEENKFILCYLVPNFGKNNVIPVSFLIYKKSDGYHIYIIKSENIVNDDGTLVTLEDIYTEEAIDLAKKELEAALEQENDPMSMAAMMGGSLGSISSGLNFGQTLTPQKSEVTDSKLNKTLYKTLLQATGGYDEKRKFDRCSKLMIKENSNPLMTLHMLGTLTPTLETKQYGNGYVFVGTVALNNSEDVKYFISDFGLHPENGKLDFYIKMENTEIKRNDLPKYKDYIRDHFDFNDDAIQNHLEVQALDNIVFIEF